MSSWSAKRVSVLKDTGNNAFTAVFEFSPGKNPAYSSVNWKSAITQSSQLPIAISSASYDTSASTLTISGSYTSSVTESAFQLTFTPPNTAPFLSVSSYPISTTLTADNNLALDVYD